jgi:sensitive to high expression protein 9
MALIRSEHAHDQAIDASKDAVKAAEQGLEEARARLEKRERAQYHEEQIWSDTIRRNSTWVTFGLMGLNIVLLIVNIVGVEPWRRKRLVNEVESLLKTDIDHRNESANETHLMIQELASPEGLSKALAAAAQFTQQHADAISPGVETDAIKSSDWAWLSTYKQDPWGDQVLHLPEPTIKAWKLSLLISTTVLVSISGVLYQVLR